MTNGDYFKNLAIDLQILDKSLYWLRRSYVICTEIGVKSAYSDEECDAIETSQAGMRAQATSSFKKFSGASTRWSWRTAVP